MSIVLAEATLTRQSYGIACAQTRFGGPRGIWLECKTCDASDVIVGSNSDEWMAVSDEDATGVFKRHGWTGEGAKMLRARCPACSAMGAAL
ncbi:hypothetical protein [Mesorhizobium sp. B2-1-2]|uniref:hypothetical protein n=1 Tax=Mesorhizobium sp. B2-1-2 TaxID=2589973 RepID=UPI00112945B1|nr:hypothetical protein [Mesorhizobium sp. B2-1-2]TPN04505.1 hypothetical protein FJ971_29610 [Mesorhizobium sp. B2-1-2]